MTANTDAAPAFDDPALLARLRTGDAAAWRTAFPLLWGPAVRVARLHLRNPGDADEVASRAIELLYRRRAGLTTPREARALLVTLTRRTATAGHRSGLARRSHADFSMPLESLRNGALEDLAERDEVAAVSAVEERFATLPQEERDLVTAYFVDARPSSQIAGLNGGNPSAVRERILRSLAILRAGTRTDDPPAGTPNAGTS